MNSKINEKKINRVINKIVEEYKPKKIILFGSYAWGKPHLWSDLDLFIVKVTNKRRLERERELRRKLLGNGFPPMDLLVYTPRELEMRKRCGDLFIKDIITNGKVLYED